MNWFKVIPIVWKDKGVIQDAVQEARVMNGNKPGWKTSSFWVKICTVDIPLLYMGVKQLLPAEMAMKIELIAMCVYTIYRAVSETMTKYQSVQIANSSTGGATVATATVTTAG